MTRKEPILPLCGAGRKNSPVTPHLRRECPLTKLSFGDCFKN